MSTDIKTPYLDVQQRVIYKSARGAYFVKDNSGKKYYSVKARYIANVNGSVRKLTTKNATPPNKIASKRVPAKAVPNTAKAMSAIRRSILAMRLRKITFTFTPEVGSNTDTIRDKALKWYKKMVSDIEAAEEVKILSIVPYETKKIAVSFRFTLTWASHRAFKSMPKEIKRAIESIIDPDDDGNFPIKVKGKPELVMGISPHIVSIG